MSEPYDLSGFNGSDQGRFTQELRDINLNIDEHVEQITLDATLMKYDLVLGSRFESEDSGYIYILQYVSQ